jgi:hypothetical protein
MSERALHIPNHIRETVREPNWYDHLSRVRGGLMLSSLAARNAVELAGAKGSVRDRASRLMVRVFAQLLEEGAVALGEAGPNWDAERKAIDTAVIHHTSNREPKDLVGLNAQHLLNLYVPKYRNPGSDFEIIGGTPIYSGHADQAGSQVFDGYHWLIREDGSREHLLPDEAIGWHAGDWETNTRSVAICFDGDFETGRPSQGALDSVAELIAQNYEGIESARVLGHNAIVQTICPGNDFGIWGDELRAMIDANRAVS